MPQRTHNNIIEELQSALQHGKPVNICGVDGRTPLGEWEEDILSRCLTDLEEKDKKRSTPQNNSLHLWLDQVAIILNEAGIDMVLFLEKISGKAEIPVTKESLKQRFWKPIQEHMTGKESTTELTTKEPDLLYKTACRILSDNFGITAPPWPNRFRENER